MAATEVNMVDKRSEMADELKKQLQRLVMEMCGRDKAGIPVIEEATRILCRLKESEEVDSCEADDDVDVPEEFKCPISKEIMKDPVVLLNGQTYEGRYIQNWLFEGNEKCPVTQQVIPEPILIPNTLMQQVISNWYRKKNIQPPEPSPVIFGVDLSNADTDRWNRLLDVLCSSDDISDQKAAAKELRLLTDNVPEFRSLILCRLQHSDPILCLLNPLAGGRVDANPNLHDDLIATLFNVSVPVTNKRLVGENRLAINVLIRSLVEGGMETRILAATTLIELSFPITNMILIGECGAVPRLVELLSTGDPEAEKEVAITLTKLVFVKENKKRAVESGAVLAILSALMMADVIVDELVRALRCIVEDNREAVEEMGKVPGVVTYLFGIMEDSQDAGVREDCVVILHSIFTHDSAKIPVMRAADTARNVLASIEETGTRTAVARARQVIRMLNESKVIIKTNAVGPTIPGSSSFRIHPTKAGSSVFRLLGKVITT